MNAQEKIIYNKESLKFYCPPMTYKLWYKNDEGRMTYDNDIPEDIIGLYRDRIGEALDEAYFFRIKHPNVTGVTPGAEVYYGKLYGTLDVSLRGGLTQESYDALRDTLTDLTSRWSIYFESHQIKTEGGDLYVRFYNSNDPILPDTVFTNKAYIDNCLTVPDAVKFYVDESGDYLRMMYYNPDSEAGGQFVENHLYLDMLQAAFDECETEEAFWVCIDECATQYLTDIDSPEFIGEARCFAEEPCDFSGQDRFSIDKIRNWVTQQSDAEQLPEMNM